jgi:hypothetical protein
MNSMNYMVRNESFLSNGKAAARGKLLGAHMIGAEVTEMIQGYS